MLIKSQRSSERIVDSYVQLTNKKIFITFGHHLSVYQTQLRPKKRKDLRATIIITSNWITIEYGDHERFRIA